MKRSLNFISEKPLLYLVATPIGNLDDVSKRTIDVLNSVDLIVAEDTRITNKLLQKLNIKKPLIYMEKHNENIVSRKIVDEINSQNRLVAYVSDAGYPCISDPGSFLVKEALSNNINISVIPGPSAFLSALVGSGLSTDHFYFHGFLDSKQKVKKEELRQLQKRSETLIFYESPYRIKKTITSMLEIFGNRKACIARELTKKHEEYIRGNIEELLALDLDALKGEMVIIVEGYNEEIKPSLDRNTIRLLVEQLTDIGVSAKDAIKQVAKQHKLTKNYVYKTYHEN